MRALDRRRLFRRLTEIGKAGKYNALDKDNISNEAFQNIRGLWEISVDLLREQAAALKNSEEEIAASLAQPVSSTETLAGNPVFAR